MIERIAEVSPRSKVRIAGGFYLLTVLTAGFTVFVRVRLVVSGDLAATVANIQAHGALFRLGFAADLVAGGFYIAVTALFYDLLRPVNNRLAWAGCCSTSWVAPLGPKQIKWSLYPGDTAARITSG